MKRFRGIRVALCLALGVWAASVSAAGAQSCYPGAHITIGADAIATVQIPVGAAIEKTQAALIAEELVQRQLLLSAFKVEVAQSSASSDQKATMVLKSAQAQTEATLQQRQNLAIMDIQDRYGATGYNACGGSLAAQNFYTAVAATPQIATAAMQDVTKKRPAKDWYALSKGGAAYSASSIFSGDMAKAREFTLFVRGPDRDPPKGGADGADETIVQATDVVRETRRNAVAAVLLELAANYRSGGPVQMSRDLIKSYMGTDGGQKWMQSLADNSERGVLLDLVRIEALNVATQAQQIKAQNTLEFAVATAALAQVDVMNGRSRAVCAGAIGVKTQAQLETR